jgi:hypothetical protein
MRFDFHNPWLRLNEPDAGHCDERALREIEASVQLLEEAKS